MADRNEKGHFEPGNSIGLRFGEGQKMHTTGRAKNCCASVQEYWNILMEQNDAGESKYTVADLEKIVKSPKSDKEVPTAKRIAAREVLDGLKSGQVGRKVMEFLFDRTQGKARQQIDLNANVFEQRVIVLVGESYLATLPNGQQVSRPVSELPDGDELKARMEKGSDQHRRNLAYLSRVGLEDSSPKLPALPAAQPMPLGGIEAIMAPEAIEKASEPIDTRPAPRILPSSPGRVHGPGEPEG